MEIRTGYTLQLESQVRRAIEKVTASFAGTCTDVVLHSLILDAESRGAPAAVVAALKAEERVRNRERSGDSLVDGGGGRVGEKLT